MHGKYLFILRGVAAPCLLVTKAASKVVALAALNRARRLTVPGRWAATLLGSRANCTATRLKSSMLEPGAELVGGGALVGVGTLQRVK